MHKSIANLVSIENQLKSRSDVDLKPNIIAVTKTFQANDIKPLIDYGHIHYGENKVQEAIKKWSDLKSGKKDIKLHMIGKLQTNKVKYAIPLFDYIHSLTSLKLAEKISSEQKKLDKKLKIFIQVNIGNEDQKNGINQDEVLSFYRKCVNDLNLNIIGLMCIPPVEGNVDTYFSLMNELKKRIGVNHLSMGMSSDYLDALSHGSTFIRIGSKIFGKRI